MFSLQCLDCGRKDAISDIGRTTCTSGSIVASKICHATWLDLAIDGIARETVVKCAMSEGSRIGDGIVVELYCEA